MRSDLLSQQVRYVLVGGWNTLFGLGVFAVLLHTLGSWVAYPWILLVTQVIAVIQAHFAQRVLVWRSRERFLPELMRFSVVYAGTYLVNLAALAFLVEVVAWPVLPAQAVVTGLIVVATFLINRSWTFRAAKQQESP